MKKRLYKELEKEMYGCGYTHRDIADYLGVSPGFVSQRFVGRRSWPIDMAYKILDLVALPREEIFKYFPPEGKSL